MISQKQSVQTSAWQIANTKNSLLVSFLILTITLQIRKDFPPGGLGGSDG